MNRNDFGLWGIDLGPEDFSKALAAAGLWTYLKPDGGIERIEKALENGYPIDWYDPIPVMADWILQSGLSAQDFAATWTAMVENFGERIGEAYGSNPRRIRLEVHGPNAASSLWYLEQLSRPEVRATSVYCRIHPEPSEIVWDWPLRVGLFSDPQSRQLRSQIEALNNTHSWVGNLVRIVDFQKGETECDLLILPQSLRAALTAVLQAPRALNTDCVLVLGRLEEIGSRSLSLLEALQVQTRASGIALTYVPITFTQERQPLQAIWFKELVRQFSHNQPIDVALYRASRDRDVMVESPLLFASRELVETALVARRLEQFSEQVQHWPDNIRFFVEPSEDELRYMLRRTKGLVWDHETDSASHFVRARETVEAKLSAAPPLPPKPRWIQAEVWDRSESEPRAVKQFLRPETTYKVVVFIGTSSEHSIAANRPFNEEALPPNKNEHRLTVVWSEPQISPEPQVATIVLPKEGNSSSCDFYLHVPSEIIAINARITILHRNRILQTALLQAAVVKPEHAELSDNKTIDIIVESVIRPGMQDLSSRTWFDGALVLNETANGVPQITKAVGESVTRVYIADLSPHIKWFDDKITEIAEKWKKFEPLGGKKNVMLLRGCAMNGSTLYDGIIRAQRADDALVTAERIQMLSMRYGERFPVEFMYGRMAPLPNAPLCPKAKESLINGRCDSSCPTGLDEEKVICPLGFWGLNRVIERHAFDPQEAQQLAGANFGLQSEPVAGRNRLNVMTNAIVAASDNVDTVEAGSTQRVLDALDEATGKQSKFVNSWEDWVTDIGARCPSLLVLLPHTLRDVVSNQQTLEISKNQRLVYANLQPHHVVRRDSKLQPVVILMGCKTAAPDIPYESFVFKFRLFGAALVIGTGSSILGRHAATVTQNFIKDIAASKSTNITFGELMLNVRRRLVADGLLMGLCLTSYGDTDWLL